MLVAQRPGRAGGRLLVARTDLELAEGVREGARQACGARLLLPEVGRRLCIGELLGSCSAWPARVEARTRANVALVRSRATCTAGSSPSAAMGFSVPPPGRSSPRLRSPQPAIATASTSALTSAIRVDMASTATPSSEAGREKCWQPGQRGQAP